MAITQPVTLEELSEWITDKARRTSGCTGLKVSVQYKLAKSDHAGKNWSDSLVVITGDCGIEDAFSAIVNAQRDAIGRFHVS
jgi:hypothetical protein